MRIRVSMSFYTEVEVTHRPSLDRLSLPPCSEGEVKFMDRLASTLIDQTNDSEDDSGRNACFLDKEL